MPKIPLLPAITAPAALDVFPIEDVSAGNTKKMTLDQLKVYFGIATGWLGVTDTWTFASADAPTYVLTVPAGATSLYTLGMRVQLTHGAAVKYFIVTGVTSTTLTLYGGTDYTLSGTTISSISVSSAKAPLGFPVDPAKWTVLVTDSTDRIQSSPTKNVWYNLGTTASQISIPIGAWEVSYQVTGQVSGTGSTFINARVTLSTANNSESDTSMTSFFGFDGASATLYDSSFVCRQRNLVLAAKTLYYLNSLTNCSGTANTVANANSVGPLAIRARCAYL